MSNEKRFTTDWWKKVFERGKPMKYGGGIELRDEDKYLFLLDLGPGGFWRTGELTRRFREKFGEEAEKIIAEVRKADHARAHKVLEAVLPQPVDPATVAENILTGDVQMGSDVEMKVAPDRSSATYYIPRCTLMEAGTASCRESGTLNRRALLDSTGPMGAKMEAVTLETTEPGMPKPGPYACPFSPNGVLIRWKK